WKVGVVQAGRRARTHGLYPRRLRARLRRAQRERRHSVQDQRLLLPRVRPLHRLERSGSCDRLAARRIADIVREGSGRGEVQGRGGLSVAPATEVLGGALLSVGGALRRFTLSSVGLARRCQPVAVRLAHAMARKSVPFELPNIDPPVALTK